MLAFQSPSQQPFWPSCCSAGKCRMRFSSVRLTGGSAALNHFCEIGEGVARAPHRPALEQHTLVKRGNLRQVA